MKEMFPDPIVVCPSVAVVPEHQERWWEQYFTDVEKKRANSACRRHGAVGARALVPRWILEHASPGETVLDFGAGHHADHVIQFRKHGLIATAFDFGANFVTGIHSPDALEHQYIYTSVSNCLNVQSSKSMLRRTLRLIEGTVDRDGGQMICNLPMSPRYLEITGVQLALMLQEFFPIVTHIGGSSSAPLYSCRFNILAAQ